MEQLNAKDMIGYTSPREKMRTNHIEKLVGVKAASFDNLPPIRTTSKEQQEADFKLKLDTKSNSVPYDMQDKGRDTDDAIVTEQERKEKAYSWVEGFVPGYDKAGGRWNRAAAFLGSKKHKEKVAVAKRHHLVRHAIHQGGNMVKAMNPNVDPNLVDLGAGLTSIGANAGIDKGSKAWKDHKKKKADMKAALGK